MISTRGPYEQGVLFVHGIGNQKQGDTLVRWGDALSQWIDDWSEGHGDPQKVRFANVVLHPHDGSPAHGDLHIGEGDDKVVWLVEEVWWAGEVQTPSYSRLALFTLQALPMALLGYVGGAFRRNRRWAQGNTRPRWLGHWAMALSALLIGLPLALVMTPVLAALIALLLIVGLVPIPGVRARVLAVQRTLTLTLGDSMILLGSPTQRSAMTTRVVDAVHFAEARGCDSLTIVAHSQGAAVVQRALDEHSFLSRPNLVTVGSGINRLHELENLGKESWLAPGFLAAAGVLAGWLWALTAAGEATWAEVSLWSLGYLGVIAVGGLASLAPAVVRRLGRKDGQPRPRLDKVVRVLAITAFLGAMVAYTVAGIALAGPAFLPIILFVPTLVLGARATYLLVFREPPKVAADLKMKVRSWLDVYSHLDPVPGGPTRTEDDAWPEFVEVRNTGSTAFDHVRYERERDDALAVIARRLLRDTVSKVRVAEDDAGIKRARDHRQLRVTILRLTRWLTAALAVVFVLRHRDAVEQRAGDGYAWAADNLALPGWMPDSASGAAAMAWGTAGVAALALVAYFVLAKLWGLWNSAESRAVFLPAAKAAETATPGLIVLFGSCLSGLLFGVLFVDDLGQLRPGESLGEWLEGVATLGFAAMAPAILFAAWWTREATAPKVKTPKVPKQKAPKVPKQRTPKQPKVKTPKPPKVPNQKAPKPPKVRTPKTPKVKAPKRPKRSKVTTPNEDAPGMTVPEQKSPDEAPDQDTSRHWIAG